MQPISIIIKNDEKALIDTLSTETAINTDLCARHIALCLGQRLPRGIQLTLRIDDAEKIAQPHSHCKCGC